MGSLPVRTGRDEGGAAVDGDGQARGRHPELGARFRPEQRRGEYESSDAVDLLIQSGRTIDPIGLEGWRIDVGSPEDRVEAEQRLQERVPATAD